MLVCWSVKGGVGTTVVVAGLAVASAARRAVEPLVVDLGGDLPSVFGAPEPDSPGLSGWLDAGTEVPHDALRRLEVEVAPGISLLPRGAGPLTADRSSALADALDADGRSVVVDAGRVSGPGLARSLVEAAPRSLLITRACPLALRRAMELPVRPSGVVVVRDVRRAITWQEVAAVCDAPVVAELDVDPLVGAAVDAGLDRRNLPRSFVRVLEQLL